VQLVTFILAYEGEEMNANAFELGYEIVYDTHSGSTGAVLVKQGELPLIRLQKNRAHTQRWDSVYCDASTWSILPERSSDSEIDKVLPQNWRQMCHEGFMRISDFKVWIESDGKFCRDYRAKKKSW